MQPLHPPLFYNGYANMLMVVIVLCVCVCILCRATLYHVYDPYRSYLRVPHLLLVLFVCVCVCVPSQPCC